MGELWEMAQQDIDDHFLLYPRLGSHHLFSGPLSLTPGGGATPPHLLIINTPAAAFLRVP